MKVLTARQKYILQVIARFSADHGYPPGVRDICNATGITSTNGVSDHLRALERKGAIWRKPGLSRGLGLTELGVGALRSRRVGSVPSKRVRRPVRPSDLGIVLKLSKLDDERFAAVLMEASARRADRCAS